MFFYFLGDATWRQKWAESENMATVTVIMGQPYSRSNIIPKVSIIQANPVDRINAQLIDSASTDPSFDAMTGRK